MIYIKKNGSTTNLVEIALEGRQDTRFIFSEKIGWAWKAVII